MFFLHNRILITNKEVRYLERVWAGDYTKEQKKNQWSLNIQEE